MTDWLPFGFVLGAGTLTTLGLALRALARTAPGGRPGLAGARRAFGATVVLSALVYALYLIFGDRWIWYY